MAYGETVFRIGVGLLIVAALGAIVSIALYFHAKKKLKKQLESEYGKARGQEGA